MREFLHQTIREAGEIAMDIFSEHPGYQEKAHRSDYVTRADIEVSDFFVKKISEMYPDHHIHTEEMARDINPGAEYEWVIDPIDGTFNFALGIPVWAILVAVLYKGETIFSAVYNPITKDLFFAEKGKGAFLNDTKISIGTYDTFHKARGFAHVVPDRGELTRRHLNTFDAIITQGARCMDHKTVLISCYVASGDLDFYISNSGADHDHLAPKLILEESGAVVTDSDGNPWQRGRSDIVAANATLHEQIIHLLK